MRMYMDEAMDYLFTTTWMQMVRCILQLVSQACHIWNASYLEYPKHRRWTSKIEGDRETVI
jgi:hypothetical protein